MNDQIAQMGNAFLATAFIVWIINIVILYFIVNAAAKSANKKQEKLLQAIYSLNLKTSIVSGRPTTLTGKITELFNNENRSYFRISGSEYNNYLCVLKDKNDFKDLKKGKYITVQGIGADLSLDTPAFEDCIIIK